MNAVLSPSTERPVIAVVLHDAAAATWPACERVLAAVAEVADVPVTFLAVPRYHSNPSDAGFEAMLTARVARGDELALHGYTHWDDGAPRSWLDHARRRWYTASEGEFCALDEAEASARMRKGIEWFEANRWPLHGFVAPAWLMSAGTWSALGHMPFDYTCTFAEVHDLRSRRTTHCHSLVYSTRSAWRRAVSRPVNAIVSRRIADDPVVRLELHPWDADYRAVKQSWQGILERFMRTRRAVTMREAVAHTNLGERS